MKINTFELAPPALGEQRELYVPSWQEICENQLALIEDLQRRNNALAFALDRLLNCRVWWRCWPARVSEH